MIFMVVFVVEIGRVAHTIPKKIAKERIDRMLFSEAAWKIDSGIRVLRKSSKVSDTVLE